MAFCTKEEFLRANLSGVDVVCMKSHYDDWGVWSHLERGGARAVNARSAIKACSDRRALDELLRAHEVTTPTSAKDEEGLRRLEFPVIRKPRLAWRHDLLVLDGVPESPDFDQYFYQQAVPGDGYDYKVYCAGEVTFGVVRPSSFAKPFEEKASVSHQLDSLPEGLSELAVYVGKVTGLEIYGVDFVGRDGKFWLVDVNPFPGFIGVPNAAEAWWDYLESSVA